MDRGLGAVEVLVDRVGDERRERREQLGGGEQALAQRGEGGRVAVPEAPARAAHVPVRQLVDVRGDRAAGGGGVVVLHPLDHRLGGGVEARERPAVEVGEVTLALDVVHVRVEDEEAVRVPQGLHELAHRLADGLQREAVAVPGLLRGEVVPAEGVRAVGLENVPGHDHVALGLRHLLPLGVEDQPEAQARLERGAAEEQGRHGEHRVEPAARLVEPLADVVRARRLLGAVLGERHAARVPPHVDQVGNAAEGLAVALEGHVVDERAVEVVRHLGAQLAQLVAGADADDLLAVLRAPDRQRRAPVALARQRPVHVVLEPVAEPPVLDVVRVPGDLLVGGEQLLLALGGAHVPARLGVVDERRVAAPAVRVGVLVLAGLEQAAGLAQRLDDRRVGLAHVHVREGAGALVEGAVGPDRVVDREAVLGGQAEVVLAEGGARVNHAGAVVERDEVAGQDGVALLPVVADVREGRLVLQSRAAPTPGKRSTISKSPASASARIRPSSVRT